MSWIKRNIALTFAIIYCVIINEFTLVHFTFDKNIAGPTLFGIRTLNLVGLLIGIIISKNYVGKKFLVVLISCCTPIVLFEILLRTTSSFDQLERPNPSYIPPYLASADTYIYKNGGYITSDGFRTWDPHINNLLESLKSDSGCKIVTLGDSMVMGYGLEASQTWPAKLNDLSLCTVYPFGVNGWTSLEQFEFYQSNLAQVDFDFLIVGVVSNDPHPRGNYCGLNYSDDIYIRRQFGLLKPFGRVGSIIGQHSYAGSYIDQVLNGIISPNLTDYGTLDNPPIYTWRYHKWEQRLYLDDVFSKWEEAIKCFYEANNHETAFLLTPTTVSSTQDLNFLQIEATLERLKIPHLNLYPELQALLGSERSRADWANPADAHPGERQTTLYANQALELLRYFGHAW